MRPSETFMGTPASWYMSHWTLMTSGKHVRAVPIGWWAATADMAFPFLHPQVPDLVYNGVILNSDTITGVFSYPVMFFLFLLPVYGKQLKARGLLTFFCACLTAAMAVCITASGYAVSNRYLTDHLYLLAIPAVFLFFCFCERCGEKNWTRPAETAALVCASAGVILFIMLSLTGEENWFRRINPVYFDQMRYALSPWL